MTNLEYLIRHGLDPAPPYDGKKVAVDVARLMVTWPASGLWLGIAVLAALAFAS